MGETFVGPLFGKAVGWVFALLLLSAVNTAIGGMVALLYVMARDRERSLQAGMDSFLAKPFKSAQLLEVLQPIAAARGRYGTVPAPVPTAIVELKAVASEPPTQLATQGQSAARATETITLMPAEALQEAVAAPVLDAPATQALLESTGTHPAPISRLPVLDLEQVQSIRGLGKPMIFERMCEMLYGLSKDAFARLDGAIADGNLEEVAAAAHALKSPVSNLGGRRLADLLERCETAALEGADIAVIRRSAAGLKAHYAALVAALQTETRRGTGTG
jgi:HPt (histidine-containing phosphotransfer) domain-containing protein/CheY-like chemotaxis protein